MIILRWIRIWSFTPIHTCLTMVCLYFSIFLFFFFFFFVKNKKFSHTDSVLLYHNPSVWLDMRDASSWDRIPVDFTYSKANVIFSVSERLFYVYIFTDRLSAARMLNSWEELCIYAYVTAGNSPLVCSTHWWTSIYIVIHRQTIPFLSELERVHMKKLQKRLMSSLWFRVI